MLKLYFVYTDNHCVKLCSVNANEYVAKKAQEIRLLSRIRKLLLLCKRSLSERKWIQMYLSGYIEDGCSH